MSIESYCPVKASLQHLDQAAAGRNAVQLPRPVQMETQQRVREEAKPVTVKFARRDAGLNRCVPLARRNKDIIMQCFLQECSCFME